MGRAGFDFINYHEGRCVVCGHVWQVMTHDGDCLCIDCLEWARGIESELRIDYLT